MTGNIFNWKTAVLNLYNTKTAEVSRDNICKPSRPGLIVVPDKLTYYQTDMFCQKLGGSLKSVKTDADKVGMTSMAKLFPVCTDRNLVWSGYKDVALNGVFINNQNITLRKIFKEFYKKKSNKTVCGL